MRGERSAEFVCFALSSMLDLEEIINYENIHNTCVAESLAE